MFCSGSLHSPISCDVAAVFVWAEKKDSLSLFAYCKKKSLQFISIQFDWMQSKVTLWKSENQNAVPSKIPFSQAKQIQDTMAIAIAEKKSAFIAFNYARMMRKKCTTVSLNHICILPTRYALTSLSSEFTVRACVWKYTFSSRIDTGVVYTNQHNNAIWMNTRRRKFSTLYLKLHKKRTQYWTGYRFSRKKKLCSKCA